MAKRVKTSVSTKSLIGIDPLAWLDKDDWPLMAGESDAFAENEDQSLASNRTERSDAVEAAAFAASRDSETPRTELNTSIPNRLILGDILNLESASDLRDNLSNRLQKSASFDIEASRVEIIDTTNLQILTAFLQEAARLGATAKINNPSEKFVEAATLLGLDTSLGLVGETPGFN